MKWREASEFNRESYFIGPSSTYYYAIGGGKRYEVCQSWANPIKRSGGTFWWSHDGRGVNKRWATKDAAMAWCEADAAQMKAGGKGER